MRRKIAVGMLGLALAGCAQSRSSLPVAASRGQPIGMEPVPSINDTINRGTGDPAIVQATLPDPKSPNWSGEFIPPRGPAGTPPGPQVARSDAVQGSASSTDPAGRASAPASAVLASPSSPPPASAAGLLAGAGMPAPAVDPQAARAPTAPPVQTLPSQQPVMANLEVSRSPGEVPPTAAAAGSPSPVQALPPVEEPRAVGAPGAPLEAAVAPAAVAPTSAAPAVAPTAMAPTSAVPTAAPNPLSAPTPVPAQAAQAPRGPATMADQLLGPDPDLMPAIDLPPPAPAKGKTTQRPEADAAAKSVPSSAGAAGASGDFPLETAPELPVDPQPIRGSLLPAAPAANPAPTTQNGQAGAPSASTASVPDRTSSQTAAAPPAPRSESAVSLASFNPDSLTEMAKGRNWKEAGRAAGRVNDEVITLHDLVLTIKAQLINRNPGHSLNHEELNMAAKSMLAHLIERTLITQEAKRVLKNPKQLDRLYEAADKYWREAELPPLMRHYLADNEYQLKQKLADAGLPLEFLRQSHRQEFLAQVYLDQKLSEGRKVELPEMLKYYNDHLHDKEYDRPAQITWRELVVEKGHHPDPADARRKADNLLARLKRGESFATLARKESEGPSSIRAQGGLMQTSPGSYAVEAVNQALNSLPLNQVSPVLEGPSSLHIVLVENRRAAGPASFEEVQDLMRNKVMYNKMHKAREVFLARLKRDALISTIFDGTESDPAATDKQ
ncbi:MAG: peptidylprolyl isomerase [Isosphaeraceae bacterium]